MKRTILLALLAPLLMQCASTYRQIDPPSVAYNAHEENDDLEFSYRYDVLGYRGNRKYSKKERKYGFNIIAAKVTNKTPRSLDFVNHLDLYSQRGTVFAVDNEYAAKTIRQLAALHLLYGLISFVNLTVDNQSGHHVYSLLPVGLGLAAGNTIVAGVANSKMKTEFKKYAPHGKTIAPGETAYVIIALRDIYYAPLRLRLRESKDDN